MSLRALYHTLRATKTPNGTFDSTPQSIFLLSVLKLVQFAINTLAMQEFFVTALFHNATFVQNNDAVNIADR